MRAHDPRRLVGVRMSWDAQDGPGRSARRIGRSGPLLATRSGHDAAKELSREHEGQAGEQKLESAFRDGVRDRHPGRDAKRRDNAEDDPVANPDVSVAVLAPGSQRRDEDDRQQRGRLGADLALVEEDRQGGHEDDSAADPDETPEGAAGEPQYGCGDVLHQERIMSVAVAIRRAAKSSATPRSGRRCCSAVPATTPPRAGIATSAPLATSTFPYRAWPAVA